MRLTETSLARLPLKKSYSTSSDDLLADFYEPVLENAIRYDRAAGFFSSGLIALAPIAFSNFISASGNIRLLCSPNLSARDITGITQAKDLEKISREVVIEDLKSLADGSDESRILGTLLSSLLASGILDLRIALPTNARGLFHDKVGIFSDGKNTVSFVGSANETAAAWSGFDNHEQIEVFASWKSDDARERTFEHGKLFNELWNGVRRGWSVMDPTESSIMLRRIFKPVEVDVAIEQVRENYERKSLLRLPNKQKKLLPHQEQAIENWESNNRKGLIVFATGGGKTLVGIEAIRRWTSTGKPALVLVPTSILHNQWFKEIKAEMADRQVILVGNGHGLANRHEIIRSAFHISPSGIGNIILATYMMAGRPEFLGYIDDPSIVLVCGDEVHNIGATDAQQIIRAKNFGGRIGLSATPGRAGSASESELITSYFEKVLDPIFTIKDAIAAKRLVPYSYYFETVMLTPQEEEDWEELNLKIKRIVAINKGKVPTQGAEAIYFKNLCIKRAGIVKSAHNKSQLALDVLSKHFKIGDRWLVYCQNQTQMTEVKDLLSALDAPILDYHQAMDGNPERTLDFFTREGGIMLAIKCLDEGVDIPEINKALILASSANPREYIQRRGRVLRTREGKYTADIYDVLVVDQSGVLISSAEAERALEFANEASNSATKLQLRILLDKPDEMSYVDELGESIEE